MILQHMFEADHGSPEKQQPIRFLILCRSPNPATLTLCQILGQLGVAEVISDQPTGPEAIWITDDLMPGFEGLASWSDEGPPITAWERAFKYLALNPIPASGVWFVEDDVAGSAENFSQLTSLVRELRLDLAALEITPREKDHDWFHWQGRGHTFAKSTRSFNPLCFLSPRLIELVLLYQRIHQRFLFQEILFASLASCAEARVLDLAVDPATSHLFGDFRFRPLVEAGHKEGICHPVKDYDLHQTICSSDTATSGRAARRHSPA